MSKYGTEISLIDGLAPCAFPKVLTDGIHDAAVIAIHCARGTLTMVTAVTVSELRRQNNLFSRGSTVFPFQGSVSTATQHHENGNCPV